MISPAVISKGQVTLIIGPQAEREAMLAIVARFALRGPVRVLDGGNSYNAFQVARLIRRSSTDLDRALDRIAIARAFTCYQVLSLLANTPAAPVPTMALDLLRTFSDENITAAEGLRLVQAAIDHLHRLREGGPVAVAVRPLPQPDRARLVELLMATADQVIIREEPAAAAPLTLF